MPDVYWLMGSEEGVGRPWIVERRERTQRSGAREPSDQSSREG